jgi:phosphohistidine phosphatase
MTARTLVLLRHAKAQTPGELPDVDRPLTDRGRADAGAAGTWLAAEGLNPRLVICSPAVRTRQTWHALAVAMATADPHTAAPEVHYEEKLYDGGRTELVDLVQAVSNDITTVLVIGHNPTVSDVSLLLRTDADPVEAADVLRTAGLAIHGIAGLWSTCEPGTSPLLKRHTARA